MRKLLSFILILTTACLVSFTIPAKDARLVGKWQSSSNGNVMTIEFDADNIFTMQYDDSIMFRKTNKHNNYSYYIQYTIDTSTIPHKLDFKFICKDLPETNQPYAVAIYEIISHDRMRIKMCFPKPPLWTPATRPTSFDFDPTIPTNIFERIK